MTSFIVWWWAIWLVMPMALSMFAIVTYERYIYLLRAYVRSFLEQRELVKLPDRDKIVDSMSPEEYKLYRKMFASVRKEVINGYDGLLNTPLKITFPRSTSLKVLGKLQRSIYDWRNKPNSPIFNATFCRFLDIQKAYFGSEPAGDAWVMIFYNQASFDAFAKSEIGKKHFGSGWCVVDETVTRQIHIS